MKLVDVKGVGESAAQKLRASGIETVDELADLDLRSQQVNGLSTENLTALRGNAARLLEARRTGELALVPGLGPSAESKLNAAGIKSIEDLVELDLRKNGVEGLSAENLQRLRREASYLT